MELISKLVKLYTPFICAIMSAIHGVLFILDVDTLYYKISGELSGQSILLLIFVQIHSKRMCKWYKLSIYFLYFVHLINLMYYTTDLLTYAIALYGGLVLNIASTMCWLISITLRTISKTVCSTHTDLTEQE